MENLRWGIVAAGRITHDFVTALSTIEQSKHVVVAVADVEGERAKQFAEKHQIPTFYDGFNGLSMDKNVDIVYVGTLNPFHYTVTRLMLERGKHVLCEKPLCLSHRQAAELYRLAKEKSVFLMEGMWSRFFPSYGRLRELLADECIGRITNIEVQHGFRAANVERILSRSLGGSITLDIGLYALQLGQLVYGCAPVSVKAQARHNSDQVDVETKILLDYGEDRKLVAFVTGCENLDNSAKLSGTKGEIILPNYWCCTSLIKPNDQTETWPLPTAKHEFHHTNSCGLRYEAEEVRKCIQSGLLECPLYTQEQSLELIRLEGEILQQIGVTYDDVLNLNV